MLQSHAESKVKMKMNYMDAQIMSETILRLR